MSLENEATLAIPALRQVADNLEAALELPAPVFVDRVAEMPINTRPTHSGFVDRFPKQTFWPVRRLEDISGVSIHHTRSHSPKETARICINKGYPTIQYHYWVSAGHGCPVWMLAKPTWMMWHDHTGTYQTTLSVTFAGYLHLHPPPGNQLKAAVRLVAWLMDEYGFPIEQVKGHNDRAWQVSRIKTQCPGWDDAGWRDTLFNLLQEVVK